MKLSEIKKYSKVKFRRLIDLEPGETVDMLPIYRLATIDNAISVSLKDKFKGFTLVITDEVLTVLHPNTDIEIVD